MPLGYEECDIHVYLDYPQERQSDKGSFVFATDGTQIDAGSLVDCIIDPVTLSIFGKPLPMTPEWMTNVVGPYYRYQIEDFNYTIPAISADYKAQNYKITGNNYLICASDVLAITSAKVYLGTDVNRNEPLFFSFSKLDKKSSSKDPIVKLFWSNTDNNDKDVQLHFTQDGGCDVYRGYKPLFGTITTSTASTNVTGVNTKFMTQFATGDFIYSIYGQLLGQVSTRTSDTQLTLISNATRNYTGSYNKKQPLKVQSYSRTESNYSGGRPTLVTANPNDQYNDVYIIPCRGNQLLVITSFGLNFCHSFADLDSTFIFPDPPRNIQGYIDADFSRVPIITPEGQFAIQIPQGKVAWQLAKLYFKANWSCESQVIETAVVPPQLPFFYLDGTIAFSNWTNPTEVVGTGTSFVSDLANGDCLFAKYGNGALFLGVILSRTSNTLLTLEEPCQYQGSGYEYLAIPRLNGTISFSTGDNIINGTGTAFLTDLKAGDKVYLGDPNYFIGFVDAVLSNSQFTIASPATFAAGSAKFYKNFNEYAPAIVNNYQVEPFGQLGFNNIPYDFELKVQLRTSNLDETLLGGDNKKFKMLIFQESTEESINYGKMFYSTDIVLNTLNQKTSDATVDIITALESLNISRSESGDLNLSFDARTKLLVDLGVVKPEILSNRPVKVTMKPRRLILTGLVSKGASDQLIGTDTLFTEELFVDQEVYLENGLFVGNIYSIESDTALTLYGYTTEEFAAEPFSPYKIFSEFVIFDGYTSAPDINYLQSGPNATTYSDYALLSFSAIDKKQRLNFEYFSTSPNFDSANIQTIIASSIQISGEGFNDPNKPTLLISPTIQSYQLPINRNNSNGQYNFSINFGDTTGGFVEKIRTDFANNFVFFSRGEWLFKAISQNGYNNYSIFNLLDYNYLPSSTNPAIDNVSMYLSETLAQNDGLIPIYASYKRTIRNLRKTYETPEANRIIIIGMNKSDGSRIQYVANDDSSQNAALSPQNRPNNWLGDVYPFCQINDKYNTFSDAIQAGDEYFKRLTTGREVIEFDSDLLTYYDNFSKSVPEGPTPLSGEIQFFDNSEIVTGTLTEFTTELEIGDVLYDITGRVIGQVYSITDDFELTLNANATYDAGTSIPFNNYTIYLKEFNYIDIGDIITIFDEDNVPSTWQILDWSCDFIREYETPSYSTPTVRNARYRAKKVTLPSKEEFVINANFVEPAPNQKIIDSGQELLIRVYVFGLNANYTYTATLSNEPTGMIIDGTGSDSFGNYYEITFTPDVSDENKIYGQEPYPITFTITDGTNSKSYQFSVRVYQSLI